MKRDIARKWAKALESGEYKQTTGVLRKGDKFCCLGVLCNLHAQEHPELAATQTNSSEYFGEGIDTPKEVMEWCGLKNNEGKLPAKIGVARYLTGLNDIEKLTFPEIAKVIRKYWKEL